MRGLRRVDRGLGDAQLAVLGDGRRDPQVARQTDARDVVLDRTGPDLTASEDACRVLRTGDERRVVHVLVLDAEDRVDLRRQGDGHVNAVALAGDVAEQVRLATGLADDDVLRALARGQGVRSDRRTGRQVDLRARSGDREIQRVGAEHHVAWRSICDRRVARRRDPDRSPGTGTGSTTGRGTRPGRRPASRTSSRRRGSSSCRHQARSAGSTTGSSACPDLPGR